MGEVNEVKKVNAANLKKAVKELNDLAVEGVAKIRTVGINVNDMALQFIKACNAVNDIDEKLLTDSMVEVYNSLPAPEELAVAQKAPKEKKAKEPKEKKVKAPKEPKEKRERKGPHDGAARSRYNHLQGAKSGKLDDMLFAGGTMEEIMAGCDVPMIRVKGHSAHLVKDLGLTLVITENKEDPMKTKYKVKEEKWVPPAAEAAKE